MDATATIKVAVCPGCASELLKPDQANFCGVCGLVLRQPCPSCRGAVATPDFGFALCEQCGSDFWACSCCGRLYHYDRLACVNSYCPERGQYWTARYGLQRWSPWGGNETEVPSSPNPGTPRPAWRGRTETPDDERRCQIHARGLLVSVLRSGAVELWAEHGSVQGSSETDFIERALRLMLLDLGADSVGAPFFLGDQLYIPHQRGLSRLDWTGSPTLSIRYESPLRAAFPVGGRALVWGPEGALFVDPSAGVEAAADLVPRTPPDLWAVEPKGSRACGIWCPAEGPAVGRFWTETAQVQDLGPLPLEAPPRWLVWGVEPTVFSERELYRPLEGGAPSSLSGELLAKPVWSPSDERFQLFLADGTVRSCSATGDRFSFLFEASGTPSTEPCSVGGQLYYGTQERYLCRNEKPLRPRLSNSPVGVLSVAQGRLFGASLKGELFCFEL